LNWVASFARSPSSPSLRDDGLVGQPPKGERGAAAQEVCGSACPLGCEVFPLEGIEDEVAEHVPRDVKVTVTSSPRRGIDRTLLLAEELARRGFEVVPHLAARLVADEEDLKRILERLHEAGIREVFVIAGDVGEPAGRFAGAAELLGAMAELGHGLEEIGISGYPESHPFISDETTIEAMYDKAPFATYIVSQLCFEPPVIAGWIAAVHARGVELPIHVGIPGAVDRRRLLRISTRVGVGESMRFLRKQSNVLAGLFRPGRYGPDHLVEGLAPALAEIAGFHVYTFNELEKTERWRQETIRRLEAAR
jgi:methylenetetrahydrofolate reductase (NADPH)